MHFTSCLVFIIVFGVYNSGTNGCGFCEEEDKFLVKVFSESLKVKKIENCSEKRTK